jgi:hypothetical protein
MNRAVAALAVLLLLAPLATGASHIFDIARDGQKAESNGLSITGGYTYARQRLPAVTFGTVQPPRGARKFTYLVFSRITRNRLQMPAVHCDLRVNGSEATDRSTLEAGGKKLALVYNVRNDRGAIASEELTVNGKKVDLQKGRIFLADFSKEELTWSQVNGGLPERLDGPGKPDSWNSTAIEILERLRKDNAAVQNFLK